MCHSSTHQNWPNKFLLIVDAISEEPLRRSIGIWVSLAWGYERLSCRRSSSTASGFVLFYGLSVLGQTLALVVTLIYITAMQTLPMLSRQQLPAKWSIAPYGRKKSKDFKSDQKLIMLKQQTKTLVY